MDDQELIARVNDAGDFLHLEDGFLYFAPSGNGGLSAHNLRVIADYLDRQNEEWRKQINNDSTIASPCEIAFDLLDDADSV